MIFPFGSGAARHPFSAGFLGFNRTFAGILKSALPKLHSSSTANNTKQLPRI
jgi:hypothetical protein